MSLSMRRSIVALCLLLVATASAQSGGEGEVNPNRHNAVITHGTIMGFAFAFLFPLGAIIIRTLSFRGLVWVHAALQIIAYTLALTGLGLGVYIAIYPDSQLKASDGHPVIGIIVVSALVFQPILGLLHHHIYKKNGKRTIWAVTHVWWGRAIVTLGIINGGLGLMLSENTVKGEIAYGVVAGVMWLTWLAVVVWSNSRLGSSAGEGGLEPLGKSEAGSDNNPERYGEKATA